MIVNLDDLDGIGAQGIERLLKTEFQVVDLFDQFQLLAAVEDRPMGLCSQSIYLIAVTTSGEWRIRYWVPR